MALALAAPGAPGGDDGLAALGRALFFDTNLSEPRGQSCATCHDPAHAFADPRDNGVGGAFSRGADGRSLGRRNTPSIAYAASVPPFARAADGEALGGLFLDGRARDLAEQAAGPLLDPLEMALPDRAALLARLREQPRYVAAFAREFGSDALSDPAQALAAAGAALAAFQSGAPFMPFDSRYDRYLRGEVRLSEQEELGRRLYFSDLANCMSCHLLRRDGQTAGEPFTDHRYHNIGVPANPAAGAAVGVDRGLAENPRAAGAASAGRFRTPGLRNVAVTAPYMHNGVFARLETALAFYNHYIVDNAEVGINPETGRPWGPPEVGDNLAHELLGAGHPMDDERIAALVAFLRTLTDRRYEHLLPPRQTQEPSHE